MIMPMPELVEPCVAFESANAFYPDRLEISEEADFVGPNYSPDPYLLIGADGLAWRVQESWGPRIPPRTIFARVLTWVFSLPDYPSLVAREVTEAPLSLDEFKNETCRRILAHPNGVFSDELLVGESLPRGGDLEALTTALIERVSANIRAATSIADAMDAMLFAQRDQYEWAEEFHRHPAVSP